MKTQNPVQKLFLFRFETNFIFLFSKDALCYCFTGRIKDFVLFPTAFQQIKQPW